MKSKFLLFPLVVVLLYVSWNHEKPDLGEVEILESMIYYDIKSRKDSLTNFPNDKKKLKSYVLINVSCATCLDKIEAWNIFFVEELKDAPVELIPICHTKSDFEQFKYLVENDQLGDSDMPLFLDLNKEFLRLNHDLISDSCELYVLTNAENKILISGNPLEDSSIRQDYLEIIDNFKPKSNQSVP